MKNIKYLPYRLVSILFIFMIAYVFMVQPAPVVSAVSWDTEIVLTTFLKNSYPWEEIDVSNVRSVKTVPLEKPERIVVEKGPIGKAIFSFFYKNGQRIIVKANVQAKERIVKSKRSFRKGHLILQEDVYVAKMNINRMPRSSVKNPEEIVGKLLRKSIIANVPIVEGMIEYSPMVKKGKRVILIINNMGLNIKTAGVIKAKGYVGSPVRAINMSSKKEVVGVLIDENTVRVDL